MIEIDEKAFTDALNRIAANEDGKKVLACLKEYCRFDGDMIAECSLENTYANATLRRAYLYLRTRIKPEYLRDIEFNYRRKLNDGRRPTDGTDVQRPAGISGKGLGAKPKKH
jgi:hypothetical protein